MLRYFKQERFGLKAGRPGLSRGVLVLGIALGLVLLTSPLLPTLTISTAAASLAPLPPGWPATLQLGLSDGPGGAAALQATAPVAFRYQYLAGGVNTGSGWATWNSDGHFVTYYIQDSVNHGLTPVFTYYMLYQSAPGNSLGELDGVHANLGHTSTMTAYYSDLKRFFQRAGAFPGTRVVLHVEPDMWGYIQQRASGDDAASVPVKVAATGLSELAGLPDNASGLAQAIVTLRDRYAPNVVLGYHLSIWGTGVDIQWAQTSDSQTEALASRAGNFYRALGARFDLAFAEFSDRDAAFKQALYGDGGRSWFDADDFQRHARFLGTFASEAGTRLVVWQIPLGNTKMRAQNNSWGHYQDNRVEWLLDDATRAHLSAYVQAGVVAFLFGGGASGTTCACDGQRDGVTDPAPINGNEQWSLSADDDGGFFRDRARAYYQAGAMALPNAGSLPTATATTTIALPTVTPTPTSPPSTTPSYTTSATTNPASGAPGGAITISAAFASTVTTTALVDIEVYSPAGAKVYQVFYDNQTLTAGQSRTYTPSWTVPANAGVGQYTVRLGLFAPGWSSLYAWNHNAAQFAVSTTTAAPTATATSTPPPSPTATPAPTKTPTPQPTNTPPPPTNTPTPAPTPTPTAVPSSTVPSFTTSVHLSSSTITRGQRVTTTISVTSDRNTTALVDLEIYDATGKKVYQRYWDNVSFSANVKRDFRTSWRTPSSLPPGVYTVKVGVFKVGWEQVWQWNNQAATLTIR